MGWRITCGGWTDVARLKTLVSRIVELWRAGVAPAVDGLYRADGSARAVRVDGPELSRFELGKSLDLERLLAVDPECLTEIDISAEAELPENAGYVCCGDGAHGSDGFFARLGPGKNLVWLVSLTSSNPFIQVAVDGWLATFTNNLGSSLAVDLACSDYS
jgi:hypothetical protein